MALWDQALHSLPSATPDDQALFDSARIMGDQIALLRPYHATVFEGLSQSMAVMLIAALANREFQVVSHKSQKAVGKALAGGPKHIEILSDIQLTSGNPANQKANADTAAEASIDCLPHALFHAFRLNEFEVKIPEPHLAQRGANIIAVASLERAYRVLWQSFLWSADIPNISEAEVLIEQTDYPAESRWYAWVIRAQSLKMEASFSKGLFFQNPPKYAEADRIVKQTITGVDRRAGFRNGPIIAPAKVWTDGQRHLAAKWLTLENSYLSGFLDTALPNAPGLTIRLLAKAFWTLGELSDVFRSELGRSKLVGLVKLRQQAFPIKRTVLVSTLANALAIESALAEKLVAFFLLDTTNLTRFFNRGAWGNPLLKAPRGETIYLLLSVLAIGDWVRAAEYWLEQGGGTDGMALRGEDFEDQCRKQLAASLAGNGALTPTGCPLTGLPKAADGEEIDLLIRIGKTVLVGECKCLLTPTEPIERYNFIERLDEGCDQANRKTEFLKLNPDVAAAALGCSPEECATFSYIGVVVTNQTFGVGYNHLDIPVIDLKYLDLICSGGSYSGDTIFDRELGTGASLTKHIYANQKELERKFATILRDPIVMRRFADRIKWIRFPIPSMKAQELVNQIPVIKELTEDQQKVEQLKAILGST